MTAIRSLAPAAKSVWDRYFATPPGLTRDEERLYRSAIVSLTVLWGMFIFYIFLFAFWGVRPLVIAAIFNLLLILLAIYTGRQQRYVLATFLAALVIIISTTLTVIFIGWDFGAQYALITSLITNVINPWYERRFAIAVSTIYTLLFIGLYYYGKFFPPLYTIAPLQLAVFNILNIVTTFVVIGAITMVLLEETDRANQANEDLLNNVLPESIVTRLKLQNPKEDIANPKEIRVEGIAESFSDVSVLFTDFVGFTPLSEQLTPQETIDLLDEIFTVFDQLAEKYGVEKIKTTGDGYMAAAGAPRPHARHAHALVSMALDMQSYIKQREPTDGISLQMRAGINSGSAVGGIVGTTRFHYDLWSDMVNTASRMESHGLPGKVQIARPTYELVKDDFLCQSRGLIAIKGKGQMEAWFVSRTYSGDSLMPG